jgi:hypothetical protein
MALIEERFLARFFGEAKGLRLRVLVDGYLRVERNNTFVAAARPLVDEGGAFIAVGAGHIAGPAGLVELFRRAGYRVEHVHLPGEAPG